MQKQDHKFELISDFKPKGGQPEAIRRLVDGYYKHPKQTLLGITGSGKSLDYDEELIIRTKKGEIKKVKIGEYVEKNLQKPKKMHETIYQQIDTHDKILSLNPRDYSIEEKEINQVSRHKETYVYEITLDDNSSTKVTSDHNFYVLEGCELSLIETKNLKRGDAIPLTTFIPKSRKNINSINLLNYNPYNRLNIYKLLKKYSLFNNPAIRKFFKKFYSAPGWKIGHIKDKKKSRGIEINIFLELLKFLGINFKDVANCIYFVGRSGKDSIPIQINVSDDFLVFAGLYVSEGHNAKDRIIVSNSNELLQKTCQKFANKIGITFVKHNKNDISYYSKILCNFFKEFGTHAQNKKIPDFIFNLTEKQISVFLRAMFDGDGWVEPGSVCYLSASKQLISDIRNLLLYFKITTRISTKKVNRSIFYQINIYGKENLTKFNDHISFSIDYKRKNSKNEIKEKGNTNVDLIYNSSNFIKNIRDRYGLYQWELAKVIGCEQSYISMIEEGSRNISKNLFRRLVKWLIKKDTKYRYLQNLLYYNFRIIKKIKKMRSTNGYVYDLAVKDNQTFMAGFGGIFVHNTFVMAHVINLVQRPTLVLAHNKTLAAQLWSELKSLFPKNRVEYFVSYYDYYQPESYLPATDTYIEKDSEVNEKIEQLRLRATASLMSRSDTIIISSVSCIYGLGSPENFEGMAVEISVGQKIRRDEILKKLVDIQYNRNDDNLVAGNFRVRGDIIDVVLGYSGEVIRINMFGDEIESINYLDPFNNKVLDRLDFAMIFPARHFVIPESEIQRAIVSIREELEERLPQLDQLFSYRLKQRTNYDLELIEQLGYCKGIENYSRHFDGRKPGEPPFCLLDFFPKDFLLIIDESHQTIPQTHGMYKGDYTRKKSLIDYGFRLESAYDNRPLKWEEFSKYLNHTIFVSATPGDYEIKESGQVVELIIRPTGLVDPDITVKKTERQMDDLISEIKKTVSKGFRVLVTTLTKRMAEDLTNYLLQRGIRVRYLHSEIETIERTEIIRSLRLKEFDVLVGINLLREGIDIPEVALVAILDADKEGFLRNTRSLIQTIGRASRNSEGRVIMYADKMTESMKEAIEITHTRRKKQIEYNKENKIIPKTIIKPIQEAQVAVKAKEVERVSLEEIPVMLAQLDSEMRIAAEKLEFERAIEIRERIKKLEGRLRPK